MCEPAHDFGKDYEESRRHQRNFINHWMPQKTMSSGKAEAGCDSS